MFSLLSGLEAVWFYKSEVRFAPPLNRLFRQAGYELGFFAGHDDWNKFQMDAFVSPQHYDRFEIEPLDWLNSDRRAIHSASEFLRKNTDGEPRPPRLAVLFLYSTHAPFAIVKQHATDQPSATVAYPIPFPPTWRPSVWNRYRNASRTLDAELAGLFHNDAITVLTGDHGESFLDDGTIGHGTKLSAVQTRVAAMICGPGFTPRQFDAATVHADVLPTLLAAAGIHVSRPEQFDGLNLQSTSAELLEDRTFSISNLVGRDVLVVPPRQSFAQDNVSGAGFGYRVEFSLLDQTVVPQGILNRQGDLIAPSDNAVLRKWLERLTSRF
jgi:membrane-anchored protein YejM (alkaline phosphatase superfamily)